MKAKVEKVYIRRTRKHFETKICSTNFSKGINSCEVPLVRYSGLFIKWRRKEIKEKDQKRGKLMTVYKVVHPRDDIDHVSRKEKVKGLVSMEECVDTTIEELKKYTAKKKKYLLGS